MYHPATIILFALLSTVLAVPSPQYSYNAANPKTDGNSNLGDQNNGADGSSASYAGLSMGALIAIGVIAGLVIIGGIASGVLFYIAKKRQWQVRKTIRRKASQIFTPKTDKFPTSVKQQQRDVITQNNTAANSGKPTKTKQPDEKTAAKGLGVKVVDTDTSSTEGDSARSTPEKPKRSAVEKAPVVQSNQVDASQRTSERDARRQQRWSQLMARS